MASVLGTRLHSRTFETNLFSSGIQPVGVVWQVNETPAQSQPPSETSETARKILDRVKRELSELRSTIGNDAELAKAWTAHESESRELDVKLSRLVEIDYAFDGEDEGQLKQQALSLQQKVEKMKEKVQPEARRSISATEPEKEPTWLQAAERSEPRPKEQPKAALPGVRYVNIGINSRLNVRDSRLNIIGKLRRGARVTTDTTGSTSGANKPLNLADTLIPGKYKMVLLQKPDQGTIEYIPGYDPASRDNLGELWVAEEYLVPNQNDVGKKVKRTQGQGEGRQQVSQKKTSEQPVKLKQQQSSKAQREPNEKELKNRQTIDPRRYAQRERYVLQQMDEEQVLLGIVGDRAFVGTVGSGDSITNIQPYDFVDATGRIVTEPQAGNPIEGEEYLYAIEQKGRSYVVPDTTDPSWQWVNILVKAQDETPRVLFYHQHTDTEAVETMRVRPFDSTKDFTQQHPLLSGWAIITHNQKRLVLKDLGNEVNYPKNTHPSYLGVDKSSVSSSHFSLYVDTNDTVNIRYDRFPITGEMFVKRTNAFSFITAFELEKILKSQGMRYSEETIGGETTMTFTVRDVYGESVTVKGTVGKDYTLTFELVRTKR